MLIDIGLAGMSGVALAAEVRQKHPDIALVYATGQQLPANIDCDGVLPKPYDSAAIAAVLRRCG